MSIHLPIFMKVHMQTNVHRHTHIQYILYTHAYACYAYVHIILHTQKH